MIVESMKPQEARRGAIADSVLGRVSLVVLFTMTFAAGMLSLYLINRIWLPVTLKYEIVAFTALAAGLLSRRLLSRFSRLLRFSTGLFALISSLALLFRLTQGYIGIEMVWNSANGADWDGLLQLGVGLVVIFLALQARFDRVERVPHAPEVEEEVASEEEHEAMNSRKSKISISRPAVFTGKYWQKRWEKRPRISTSNAIRIGEDVRSRRSNGTIRVDKKKQRNLKVAKTKKLDFRRVLSLGRRKAVQLSNQVDFMCPYCLEDVVPNDPRGIEVCKVCGTPHHADCWAVTGVCQIPHQNE
jgi:hypothetical protein